MKKFVAIILAFIFVLATIIIPDFDSFALIVVPEDDSSHYYLYNHIEFDNWSESDFLSVSNYDLYYDNLVGDYKTQVSNMFIDTNSSVFIEFFNNLISPNYNVTSGVNPSGLYFYPITYNDSVIPFDDCVACLGYAGNNINQFYLVLYYSPSGNNNFVHSGGTIYNTDDFIMSYTYYTINVDSDGYNYFSYINHVQTDNVRFDSSNSVYYWNYGNSYLFYYSDFPILFNYNNVFNSDYDTDIETYLAFKNDVDIVKDRRFQAFIDKIDGNDSSIDDNSLGVLSGSFYNIFGGASLGDMSMMTVFELNDYTKSIRNNVNLVYDYTFNFSGTFNTIPFTFSKSFYDTNGYFDTYTVGSANYLLIDIDEVLSRIKTNPNRSFNDINVGGDESVNSAFSQIMATQTNESFKKSYSGGFTALQALDLLQNVGLNIYTTYNKKNFNFSIDANANIVSKLDWDVGLNIKTNSSSQSGVVSSIDYANLIVNIMLQDYNGNVSTPFIYTYDFKSGTHTYEGGFETDNIDSSTGAIIPFDNKYTYGNSVDGNYLNPYIPSDYNISSGTSNGGGAYGGNASVGDITINTGIGSVPYILIDIPENEWMDKTPNLSSMLDTYKTALATTKDESILPLIATTYNFIPEPVMNYLLYAVGIICMIGIWKAITRR